MESPSNFFPIRSEFLYWTSLFFLPASPFREKTCRGYVQFGGLETEKFGRIFPGAGRGMDGGARGGPVIGSQAKKRGGVSEDPGRSSRPSEPGTD